MLDPRDLTIAELEEVLADVTDTRQPKITHRRGWIFNLVNQIEDRRTEVEATCTYCGSSPTYEPNTHASYPGHIYSVAGIKEFSISHVCEYCFDELSGPEDYGDSYDY